MVFVSPRPVHVQGADSPGCYIKELWVCGGPTQPRGHINWAGITPELRYIQPRLHCLFWPSPLYVSALLLRRRGGGGGGGRSKVGARWAHGSRKCRLIQLHILAQLKLHLSKCVTLASFKPWCLGSFLTREFKKSIRKHPQLTRNTYLSCCFVLWCFKNG